MSRPLLVIFLTIFVNLVGFGIIIPLLPFYASTFGASPFVVGLLFASFSLAQLIASPLLGELSDRWGRRPVLILSLIGTAVSFAMLAVAQSLAMLFAARIVDGLSGGNITTARAYIADITEEENRAKAYGVLGAAFGLGFIVGPALGAAFSHISYTAPIWAAAAITVAATVMAWVWLPETVHRAHAGGGAPWHARAGVESSSGAAAAAGDRLHLLDVVRRLPDDVRAVRGAPIRLRRDAHRLSAERVRRAGRDRPGRSGRADRAVDRQPSDAGRRADLHGVGWFGSALTYSVPVFVAMLVPAAFGIGLCNATLTALVSNAASRREQGRVQGAAGALESLGRTLGPVWGNAVLQRIGEGAAYGAAAGLLLIAAGDGRAIQTGHRQPANRRMKNR